MKNIRILIALALIVAVVVIAQGGVGAWTAKLEANPESVAPAAPEAGARPQGTVGGSPIVQISETECSLLATFCVTSPQTGLTAKAITELPSGVTPLEGAKAVFTRMIEISGNSTPTSKEIFFTVTPPLATGEIVAYWDGKQWVELTLTDGKYTIPSGASLPLVIAVFTK